MNKKDIRGIDKAIIEKDAVIEISMGKKNVRKLKVMVDSEEAKIYTSFTLNDVLRKASKNLLLNQNESQVCVCGSAQIENGIDWLLTKKFYITIIQEKDVFDNFTVIVKAKSGKHDKVVHSLSVFQIQGVYEALKQIDDWSIVLQQNIDGLVK